ncbi:NfeD family protein [Acidipropionibacterium timonense]|uniref:NfeD family protein n=1 Tax=Acidipropionibacterium timonense TaxID=2161818 RepID=UPI0010313C5A|nr:NfeD family protein [Acidipropionibacterium timonense]
MNYFSRHLWLAWLVASAVLACLEMLTGDFTLLMIAAGALAGAVTAAVLPGMWLAQVIVAVVVAVLLLAVLRPTLLRRVRNSPGYRSSLDSLVGAEGVAVGQVTDGRGEVKVNGDTWTARLVTPGRVVEDGERVEVYGVEGTTLLVYPADAELGWPGRQPS